VARWEKELDTAQLAAALGGQAEETAPAAGLQPAE
jgi:aerobic C4-dicarboxylate transport protein